MIKVRPYASTILTCLSVGYLWFVLINQLRPEWSVNPQYRYGWAVPILCLYLLWGRLARTERTTEAGAGKWNSTISILLPTLFIVLAGMYLPTRLIQEANPEWRLVSWLLAGEVVGFTLLALYWSGGSARVKQYAFPILYFLVAVPWPTVIEGPLIQGLTRANTAITVEALSLFGFPAVQRGNSIEIASGVVGVDEACSGIRSLQASLMIALLLGETCRLGRARRIVLCLAGFALVFATNVGRTFLLTALASRKGIAAISQWHDPAGITILVACFLGLWQLSLLLRRQTSESEEPKAYDRIVEAERGSSCAEVTGQPLEGEAEAAEHLAPRPEPASGTRLYTYPLALVVWTLIVEVGVEFWYRSHEAKVARSPAWSVQWPRDNPTFREQPMTEKARRLLRYDEAVNVKWREEEHQWQVIYLRWQPGRIAVHLARSHTPEICLPAAGRKLEWKSELKRIPVHDLFMPFQSYQVREEGGLVHVFYCLREDLADDQSYTPELLTYRNRLTPVLAGRRNAGQRSLEIVVSGFGSAQEAEAAVVRRLGKLVKVEKEFSSENSTP